MTILVTLSNGTDTFGFRDSQILAISTSQQRAVAELRPIKGKARSQLLGYNLKKASIRARFHRDDFSSPPTSPDNQLAGLQFLYDMEAGVFDLKIDTKLIGTFVFESLDITYVLMNGSTTVSAEAKIELVEHHIG
ncbi:MAG: hypothetical protein F6K14_10815 [Symploca sp. SIO2C1]|nr:hypothetical protein [Symploca sp. SIO2C1]